MKILLAKLSMLNFSQPVINWLRSYLTDRKQCVKTPSGQSEWHNVKCGVPQGSILGPLLYSLYILDIGKCIKNCFYHLYADDLQLYLHCKLSELNQKISELNSDLNEICKWSVAHALRLNPEKSQSIIFSKQNISYESIDQVIIDNKVVPFVEKVKNLGVIFDCDLSWTYQVSAICQRIYYGLYRLYKFRNMTPTETRVRLVSTLLLPLFDYCIMVYCDMDAATISRLQVAQNNCIRYIYDLKRNVHVTPYYSKLGWLKIRERLDLQIMIQTHKILHGYAPPYLSPFFKVMSDVRERATRAHSLYLQAPLVGKKVPEKSFSVQAYRLWNNLSPAVCSTKNTATFRSCVEKNLLKLYLCSKL
jgi:hypothetical protein